ncbi:MAG TPA: HDIG domain-containing protein, partial [Polyangia bacterium]|nr:HDIG domain-containing protein [Polyangia bacterium]
MSVPPEALRAQVPADVLAVCRRLREAGHQAHLVGGGVRDMIAGRPPADFDLATDARPDAVVALFRTFAIPTGLKHGTVTVLTETRRPVEVTTFRGEGEYLDGRRPTSVTYVDSLAEDLGRRDFTMNAIAFDPLDGRLTDPYDGQGDLGRRLIRAVGDPLVRFREDGLRPLRAVRQAAQLEFEVDPPTLAAIPRTLDVFRKVSAERVRDELTKLLLAPRPVTGIRMLVDTGIAERVLPEVPALRLEIDEHARHKDVYEHSLTALEQAIELEESRGHEPDLVLRLAVLLHDIGKPATRVIEPGGAVSFHHHDALGARMAAKRLRELRFDNAVVKAVSELIRLHLRFFGYADGAWTDSAV